LVSFTWIHFFVMGMLMFMKVYIFKLKISISIFVELHKGKILCLYDLLVCVLNHCNCLIILLNLKFVISALRLFVKKIKNVFKFEKNFFEASIMTLDKFSIITNVFIWLKDLIKWNCSKTKVFFSQRLENQELVQTSENRMLPELFVQTFYWIFQ
jgi:hypothetical protein